MDRRPQHRGTGPDGRGGRAARRRRLHGPDAVLAGARRWALRTPVHARNDLSAHHLPVHLRLTNRPAHDLPQAAHQRTQRDHQGPRRRRRLRQPQPVKDTTWPTTPAGKTSRRSAPNQQAKPFRDRARPRPRSAHLRPAHRRWAQPACPRGANGHHPVRDLAAEEGGGAKNRLDTLARVAEALDRHLDRLVPEKVPARLKDAVQVA